MATTCMHVSKYVTAEMQYNDFGMSEQVDIVTSETYTHVVQTWKIRDQQIIHKVELLTDHVTTFNTSLAMQRHLN